MPNKEDRNLSVFLTEYNNLRSELVTKFDHQIKIFSIIVAALGASYGLIFRYHVYDLILLIPVLFFVLGLRFQYENYGVEKIGEYLIKLENQMRLVTRNSNWAGWQHYWKYKLDENTGNRCGYEFLEKYKKIFFFDVLAKWALFIAIPMVIATFYSFTMISGGLRNLIFESTSGVSVTRLNSGIYLVLGVIYLLLLVFISSLYLCKNWKKMQLKKIGKVKNKEKKSLVFQYGSNCLESEINSSERLDGAARFLDIAKTVGNYKLCFNVFSRGRNGGASDIVKTDNGKVWGVLYEIPENLLSRETSPEGIKSLDQIEGEGINYTRYWLPVERPNGQKLIALTYVVKEKRETQTNFDYAKLIIDGLIEHHGIPEEYINEVKKIVKNNNPEIDVTKL